MYNYSEQAVNALHCDSIILCKCLTQCKHSRASIYSHPSTITPTYYLYPDAKHTLCRNVVIYGHCRYENSGCNFQHDRAKISSSGSQNDSKKKFNADSPAFQPTPLQSTTNLQLSANGASSTPRNATISPKALNAAIFTPKSQNVQPIAPSTLSKDVSQEFVPSQSHQSQDYVDYSAGAYDSQYQMDPSAAMALNYDTYNSNSPMTGLSGAASQMSLDPYSQSAAAAQAAQAGFYQNVNAFQPNWHHYFPAPDYLPPRPAYQKSVHEFFISNNLREELSKKMDACAQTLPGGSSNALAVENYHSLVPLPMSSSKSAPIFGYKSFVFKAIDKDDGKPYAIRRLENFSLFDTVNVKEIVNSWKKIINPNVVGIHKMFTTRAFGDGSFIVVTDYHPLTQSLAIHLPSANRRNRDIPTESVLWGYIVQISNALKDIHALGLAARVITPSKILLTSQNRVRINGCGILDVTQGDSNVAQSLEAHQSEDIRRFGVLILSIGLGQPISVFNTPNVQNGQVLNALSQFSQNRNFSPRLQDVVRWLVQGPSDVSPEALQSYDILSFLRAITPEITSTLSSALHAEDRITSLLGAEVENGRLVRLMTKLGMINERTEYDRDPKWSESGARYPLKLFRDYVFHQVDSDNRPSLDIGHVITCLNKLDAGVDEKIMLTSRDNEHIAIMSYKELSGLVTSAYNELSQKPGQYSR
ncbi:hypothetical protein EJ05DRAFT_453718 [Pseudovirgaria hyperparasitica]|uniref:PAN2-PAN3 deadenylation complex subunit PAN3 n=1 Tax=Pseudovirgaria hyperparasitica TaxID=470096 RepID=A0A6A6W1L8_9PEZI|nr:uncharacterized protein EJ05DRAFT_453718 [Pseudovirgaria hyperparasitica]KAF2756818.1 hypothetical protein EJ05DRAFT_453718 [Pseudovirgaria hyperparasitica]